MSKRKVAVILVDRANYGRLKPVMRAIQNEPELEMQVVCAGTMVLERFGSPVKIVRNDGFPVDSEIYLELEGSTPLTMAKSLGFAVIEFASELQRLKPDVVLLIGDRYEAFAATIAASYMNYCIAHIQGGEVSGSIDESARHCMTKLSHFHFPSTRRSAQYIIDMGENPDNVFFVGCPSGDIARQLDMSMSPELFNKGVGGKLNPNEPYLLVAFHPVTTEFGHEKDETLNLLNALAQLKKPTIWLWPNIDAGADHVSKAIRSYRENNNSDWLRLVKNFPADDYLRVLANAECAIGNSSSFVRDSSFFGTPVVLVGDRQQGRETGANVMPVNPLTAEILQAVQQQLQHGRYPPDTLYGDGHASEKIVQHLLKVKPYAQKRLHYTA